MFMKRLPAAVTLTGQWLFGCEAGARPANCAASRSVARPRRSAEPPGAETQEMTHHRRLPRFFCLPCLSLATALALPLTLSACAGALSHIETQRRLDETYAGFPPVFGDPQLNAYRARYLAEWPAYEADPQDFLGV